MALGAETRHWQHSLSSLSKCSLILVTTIFSAFLAIFVDPSARRWLSKFLQLLSGPCDTSTVLLNGTQNLGRTVLLVSLDGFRPDYLTRGVTPHLTDIIKCGIRAEYLEPVFPTLTFPTGLYAESHGIIANDFHDAHYGLTFSHNSPIVNHPHWWLGEPIWATVERAGLRTANIMWPGPQTTSDGVNQTYYIPWKLTYTPEERVTQVLEWLDLPLEQRPHLILVYEPLLDRIGHVTGPESEQVDQALALTSHFVDMLVNGVHIQRNLSHLVDIIVVSDHGMTDTSAWEMVYMDDILCDHESVGHRSWPACAGIEQVDGWPSMGFWFGYDVDVSAAVQRLISASKEGKFDVYASHTYPRNNSQESDTAIPRIPERYHYSSSSRLAPIWVIPRMGYALTYRAENGSLMSVGNHGYDNNDESMRAIFIAKGPFAQGVRARLPRAYREGDHYVLPPFRNVEIYNLIVRLLGIEEWAAETNGTRGFWDKWIHT